MKKIRILSIIMIFAITASLLPVSAYAADVYDAGGTLTDQCDTFITSAETDVTISGDLIELNAAEGGSVIVTGDINGTLTAGTGADITVNGDIDGGEAKSPVSVSGDGTELTIIGDLTAMGGTALAATGDSDVNITGNIDSDGNGLTASGDANIKISGDVDAGATAVCAYGNSDVDIDGDVKSYGDSINCGGNAKILIEGDVTSRIAEVNGYSCGISADNNAEIFIDGDLTAEDGISVKLFARGNGGSNYAEIKGDVTGDVIIDIWEDGDKSSTLIVDGVLDGQFLMTRVLWDGWCLGHDVLTDFNTSRANIAPNILLWKANCTDGKYLNGTQKHIQAVTGWSERHAKGHDVTEQEESDFEKLVNYIIHSDSSVNLDNTTSLFDYSTAKEGDKLTFTVNSKEGYNISKITAGNGIDVTDNGDGTYSVIVPRFGGVDLKCIYEEIVKAIPAAEVYIEPEDNKFIELEFDAVDNTFTWDEPATATVYTNMETYDSLSEATILEGNTEISHENFMLTIVDGKLSIEFVEEFLTALSAGTHTFTITFANGQTFTFTLVK